MSLIQRELLRDLKLFLKKEQLEGVIDFSIKEGFYYISKYPILLFHPITIRSKYVITILLDLHILHQNFKISFTEELDELLLCHLCEGR